MGKYHPIDDVGEDVIEKLRNLGAALDIQYYVLGVAWKIHDAAQHRMHWTALLVGLGSFVLGFATCVIILYWL